MKLGTCSIWIVLVLGLSLQAAELEPLSKYICSPDFLPGCSELLREHPALVHGGGLLVPSEKDTSWLVLGVGTASLVLENGRKQSEQDAWKVANDDALAALSEALWGVRISAHESVELKSRSSETGSRVEERFERMSVTEREGMLAKSWEVGRWKFGRDNSEVGVLRIVASPGHPVERLAGRIPVVSNTLDPTWREKVLTRPALRYGGVVAVQHQGKTWLLVAGVKQVKKSKTVVSPEDVIVAQENANVEWLRFVQGTRIQNQTQSTLEMIRLQMDNEPARESFREMLSSRTKANEYGRVRLIPVGMWLADTGDAYRLAAVYRWTRDGRSDDPGYPMSRPTVPR